MTSWPTVRRVKIFLETARCTHTWAGCSRGRTAPPLRTSYSWSESFARGECCCGGAGVDDVTTEQCWGSRQSLSSSHLLLLSFSQNHWDSSSWTVGQNHMEGPGAMRLLIFMMPLIQKAWERVHECGILASSQECMCWWLGTSQQRVFPLQISSLE